MGLNLYINPIELTASLVNIPSESHNEKQIVQQIELALHKQAPWLEITRIGNSILARTKLNRPLRIILAGHVDTVPIINNIPSFIKARELWGCGTSDMKAGNAVFLYLITTISKPCYDITLIMYDCEEVEYHANGLSKIKCDLPEWLEANIAIFGEPSDGFIEAGCQGTMRISINSVGTRSHSARPWSGSNAIHNLTKVLNLIREYQPHNMRIENCNYQECLSAVQINGGISGNIIPDTASIIVNFRFIPNMSIDKAFSHLCKIFKKVEANVNLIDASEGALPNLNKPVINMLLNSTNIGVRAKYGWTDVARLTSLGIPSINWGPGSPNSSHKSDERINVSRVIKFTKILKNYLS